jgi:uncharacterized protein YfdQ (DUF2303 family)
MDTVKNIAETVAEEARKPFPISANDSTHIAVPEGYKLEDMEKFLSAPRRKTGRVSLTDTESFIAYSKRHGSLETATIWCQADYSNGKVSFAAVLNDHGEKPDDQQWRDHTASFKPEFSEEWKRWDGHDKKEFNQAGFASFLEENLKDIASVAGSPTGTQMLEMALSFEANQDMRFKSAIRLQNGGVQMNFVQDDDASTLAKMQMFDRFSLGMPIYWNGDAYQVDARLRYRVRDGKLTFWFELIRSDKVLEAATKTLIEKIKDGTGFPFFFGIPLRNEP